MDSRKAKHLVTFWLEAQSFRISSETKQKFLDAKTPSDPDKCDDVFQNASQSRNSGCDNSDSFSGVPPVNSTCGNSDGFSVVPPVDSACDISAVGGKTMEQSSSVDSGCEVRSKDSVRSVEAVAECDVGAEAGRCKSEKIKRGDAVDEGAEMLKDGLVRLETSTCSVRKWSF